MPTFSIAHFSDLSSEIFLRHDVRKNFLRKFLKIFLSYQLKSVSRWRLKGLQPPTMTNDYSSERSEDAASVGVPLSPLYHARATNAIPQRGIDKRAKMC